VNSWYLEGRVVSCKFNVFAQLKVEGHERVGLFKAGIWGVSEPLEGIARVVSAGGNHLDYGKG
jgi:hypothetical protein